MDTPEVTIPRPPRNLPPSLVAPPMSLPAKPPLARNPPAAFAPVPTALPPPTSAPPILAAVPNLPGKNLAALPNTPPAILPPADAALPPPFKPIKPSTPAPTVLAPSQSVLNKPPLSSSSLSLSPFFLPFPKPNGKRLAIIEANRKSRLACFSSSAFSFFSSNRFLRLSAMPFSRKPSPSTSPKVPAGSGIRLSKRL